MSAVELGAVVIEEALGRAQVDPAEVDEVLIGNILAAGLGMNPARQAAVRGGAASDRACYDGEQDVRLRVENGGVGGPSHQAGRR